MRAAPAVSRAMCTESARTSIQDSGEHPTFPAQWLYGLLRALPGDRLSCHHHRRDLTRQPDASTEAAGPHDFTVRSRAVRYRHYQRPPTFVTIMIRPSDRDGIGVDIALFAILKKRNIFYFGA